MPCFWLLAAPPAAGTLPAPAPAPAAAVAQPSFARGLGRPGELEEAQRELETAIEGEDDGSIALRLEAFERLRERWQLPNVEAAGLAAAHVAVERSRHGRTDAARQFARTAVRLAPDHPFSYAALARVAWDEGAVSAFGVFAALLRLGAAGWRHAPTRFRWLALGLAAAFAALAAAAVALAGGLLARHRPSLARLLPQPFAASATRRRLAGFGLFGLAALLALAGGLLALCLVLLGLSWPFASGRERVAALSLACACAVAPLVAPGYWAVALYPHTAPALAERCLRDDCPPPLEARLAGVAAQAMSDPRVAFVLAEVAGRRALATGHGLEAALQRFADPAFAALFPAAVANARGNLWQALFVRECIRGAAGGGAAGELPGGLATPLREARRAYWEAVAAAPGAAAPYFNLANLAVRRGAGAAAGRLRAHAFALGGGAFQARTEEPGVIVEAACRESDDPGRQSLPLPVGLWALGWPAPPAAVPAAPFWSLVWTAGRPLHVLPAAVALAALLAFCLARRARRLPPPAAAPGPRRPALPWLLNAVLPGAGHALRGAPLRGLVHAAFCAGLATLAFGRAALVPAPPGPPWPLPFGPTLLFSGLGFILYAWSLAALAERHPPALPGRMTND